MNEIPVTSILNKKKKTDSWFLDDYTVNLYSGCSFNCLYCYIRGSKYGENMTKKTTLKQNAISLLEKQLYTKAKKEEFGFVVMSSATDPYLHFEEELMITRSALELFLKYKFPVHIITKSPLIERDIDLLLKINAEANVPAKYKNTLKGVLVSFSFSTIKSIIAAQFEPGAPKPELRLMTMKNINQTGIKTGVSMMPLLPYISDIGEHLHEMFVTFKQHGASYILPSTLTLFGNESNSSKTLVLNTVKKHYPHLIHKYHTFFGTYQYMPKYYNDAFMKKCSELSQIYKIPMRIIKI